MTEIPKILLESKIAWIQVPSNKRLFKTTINRMEFVIRRNNFPEEPLFTLIFANEEFDFDDSPENWKFVYSDFGGNA